MASDHRPPPGPLSQPAHPSASGPQARREREQIRLLAALTREPWRFGFFHTLRRFDCLHPERPRIGASPRAADDPLRLGQKPSMVFAPAELAGLEGTKGGRPPRLLVYLFGLLGPNGPLPLHLTQYAQERARHASDPTFARFLDLFNHRMLCLFYRGWGQAQPAVSFDRPEQDRFGTYLATLGGTGMPAFESRDAMPDLAKRHFAGHLACQTRHAEGLVSTLEVALRLPVGIEEFLGHWLALPPSCRLRLGAGPDTGALGETTTLGGRVWDHQSKFRLRIGPVGLSDYLKLLPGGELLTRIKAVVRNYVGDQLDWDLRPVLAEGEVPPLRLGAGVQLGWTSWLANGPLGRDGDDLRVDPRIPRQDD
jgi:type VI secretion system protein ImpH